MTPRTSVFAGIAATFAFAALWHGPVGNAGVRLAAEAEELVRLNLEHYEMEQVSGWMQREPLTRRVWLTGEADDFQRSELVRLFETLDHVSDVQWWRDDRETVRAEIVLPLVVEAELAALSAFAIGFILTYLVARRRRVIRDAII